MTSVLANRIKKVGIMKQINGWRRRMKMNQSKDPNNENKM